jgi:phage-related protein
MSQWKWTPTRRGSSQRGRFAAARIQFGGGFIQRVRTQTENLLRSWRLEFSDSPSQVRTMRKFLKAHGGTEDFTFEDPDGDGPCRVVCEEFETTPIAAGRQKLRAVFEEVRS